ncbi:hypothetical protein BH23GEM9_BH23GEM9_01040 [soil metagenome]
MYMFINALLLALLLPAENRAEDGPACRAELTGRSLLTTVEFATGLMIEGPWQVLHSGQPRDKAEQYLMVATLDRVIERDMITGGENVIPFAQPLSLSFEGETREQMIQRAARVWCVTIMRARENRSLQQLSPHKTVHTRIAVLPEAEPVS